MDVRCQLPLIETSIWLKTTTSIPRGQRCRLPHISLRRRRRDRLSEGVDLESSSSLHRLAVGIDLEAFLLPHRPARVRSIAEPKALDPGQSVLEPVEARHRGGALSESGRRSEEDGGEGEAGE